MKSFYAAFSLAVLAATTVVAQEPVPTPAETQAVQALGQPESWFVKQLSGKRVTVDGQTLDPKIQYVLALGTAPKNSAGPPADPGASVQGRAALRAAVDRSWTFRTKVSAPMAKVVDREVPGRGGAIPIRIYTPAGAAGPLPVLVYFHGGGWLTGSIAGSDRAVRLIANEARVVVVSVQYRLAPEHPYPAAWDDAEDAFAWVAGQAAGLGGDPAMIAVGGDSAGGNLAVSVSRRRIAAGQVPPLFQLLYYPAVDLARDYPSWRLFGRGYGLDVDYADYVLPRVFPGQNIAQPDISPIRAWSLEGMPATILATAGFDILRDAGRAYAKRLERAGVSVLYLNYASLNHSFLQASGVVDAAAAAATDTARIFGAAIRSRAAIIANN
jgi:acetyl esterase